MITMKINLSAFTHVKMTKKGKDGNLVKGIFIPIEMNNIFESQKSGALYVDFIAFEVKNPKDDTHIIKQSLSKEKRASQSEEEKRAMPIFGNLNDGSTYEPITTNNDLANGEILSEDKDLPW